MTSHNSNAEQEEPTTTELPSTEDSTESGDEVPERDDDSHSDSGEGVDPYEGLTDEEAMKKWLSTAYDCGSKKPMKAPLTAPWGVTISHTDVEKLKVGFKAKTMDDKWDLLVEDPDEDGGISLHILRNWLQEECYVLHVIFEPKKPSSGSFGIGGSDENIATVAKIQSITWEGNKAGLQADVEQAKKEAVILTRHWLGCEFAALPHYPFSEMWKSKGYKRLNDAGEVIT